MPPRPLKVFLCHAHADRDPVRGLYARLTQDGVDAWLDEERLLPGQVWRDVIEESVRTSDIVLVCLSARSVTKEGFVQKEIKIALDVADEKPEDTIFVIPARLDECVVPRRLKDLQWADLFDESGYRRLMLAFNEKSKRVDASFELPKQYSVVMPSDEMFIKKVVEELEKTSFWERLIASIRRFVRFTPIAAVIAALIVFVGATIIFASLGSSIVKNWFLPISTITPTATQSAIATPLFNPALVETFTSTKTVAPTFTVTNTQTFTPTLEPTFTHTLTPTPVVMLDRRRVPMVLVPGGFFQVYSEQGLVKTYINSFYIDQYEVTNAQYKECVNTNACTDPFTNVAAEFENVVHYGDKDYDSFPVVLVSWGMAESYCRWRDADTRLPTTVEWEAAARGSLINQPYPWGDTLPTCNMGSLYGASFSQCDSKDAFPIMQFLPNGYGLYDMAGNVGEWVNNMRDDSGIDYVIRGGSWLSDASQIKVTSESRDTTSAGYVDTGFRCARDANP